MQEPQIIITQEFLKLISELDVFKGNWETLTTLSRERLSQLRRVATIESIGSSTRIEGAKLTDGEIEVLLSNINIESFETRDEQEVAGYHETMDLIFQSWEDMPLTENHIKQLHQILLRHSTKDKRHRGEYKKLTNDVVAFDRDGNEIGVVFKTTSPFDTPREMEKLVSWLNKALFEESQHPLILIGVFIVVFLAIHPFQDGNGRLSRILTTLLLMRAGYVYVPFTSLERVVEDNKDLYYRALRRTQGTLNSESPDWQPWIGFFLRCLKQQKRNMENKITKEGLTYDNQLPALAVEIIRLSDENDRITRADILVLTGANENTIKKYLRELVRGNYLRQYGKGRATWYTKA